MVARQSGTTVNAGEADPGALQLLRQDIDSIDVKLMELLEHRLHLSRQIGDLKVKFGLPAQDACREKLVLMKIQKTVTDEQVSKSVLNIYNILLQESRAMQGL